jgi:hypothetical protein
MRQQHSEQPGPKPTVRLWNYAAAVKAVSYFRAVVRSLREHWLQMQRARRQIERLDAQPGRPDRQTLIRRTEAAREAEQARGEFAETLVELNVLDVYSLSPVQGVALIPIRLGDDLAWFVFDLFSPAGIEAWQFDTDPPETRRLLADDPGATLSASRSA